MYTEHTGTHTFHVSKLFLTAQYCSPALSYGCIPQVLVFLHGATGLSHFVMKPVLRFVPLALSDATRAEGRQATHYLILHERKPNKWERDMNFRKGTG